MRCLGFARGLASALRAFAPRGLDLIVLRVDVLAMLCRPVHFLVTAGRAACLVVGFFLAIVASLVIRTAEASTSPECRVGKGASRRAHPIRFRWHAGACQRTCVRATWWTLPI